MICLRWADQSFAKAQGWYEASNIDLWDTDKSQYFAITYFNNNYRFIIWSKFFSTKDVKSLSDSLGNESAIFTQECGFNFTWVEYYLQQNNYYL